MKISRTLQAKLQSLAMKFPFVTLTGPRQSGKSTLAAAAFPDYRQISLEDLDNREFAANDPRGFIATYPSQTIIDEVQKVPSLLSYLQTHADRTGKMGMYILTGSQNFELMKAIDQSLAGRTGLLTLLPFSHEEMQRLVLRHMPEFTITEYDRMKQLAGELSAHVICNLSQEKGLLHFDDEATRLLEKFSTQHPFIQLISLTDDQGILKCMALTTDKTYRALYKDLAPGFDFSDREWFKEPMKTGDLHIMDVYPSRFTGKLIITVSCAVTDAEDRIVGVLSCDMQVEQILKHAQELVQDED